MAGSWVGVAAQEGRGFVREEGGALHSIEVPGSARYFGVVHIRGPVVPEPQASPPGLREGPFGTVGLLLVVKELEGRDKNPAGGAEPGQCNMGAA